MKHLILLTGFLLLCSCVSNKDSVIRTLDEGQLLVFFEFNDRVSEEELDQIRLQLTNWSGYCQIITQSPVTGYLVRIYYITDEEYELLKGPLLKITKKLVKNKSFTCEVLQHTGGALYSKVYVRQAR